MRKFLRLAIFFPFCVLAPLFGAEDGAADAGRGTLPPAPFGQAFRAPVDLALVPGGRFLLTANQQANSVSLVDIAGRKVLDEYPCGAHPAGIAVLNETEALVSCADDGTVHWLALDGGRIAGRHVFQVGMEPIGLAVDPARRRAFVGLAAAAGVVELDLDAREIRQTIEVGTWPRYLALTPDGKRLAVASSGEGRIFVVDVSSSGASDTPGDSNHDTPGDSNRATVLYDEALSGGINLGHMQVSRDGQYVYFPWMIYRTNPIDVRNIQLGWVLASRIGRVRLDGPAVREAISLDVPRLAIADPHGLAISPNEHRLVVTASGTHELLVYRLGDLPFVGTGGPGDLIDRRLLRDRDLFYRIELGGRPMGVAIADDNRTAYVANATRDAVQIVDIEQRQVLGEIATGAPDRESPVFRGMEIFYDGRRSLDQWYSCHTCHYNGGINSRAMDTRNDGSELTFKTVLPLYHVTETGPWTWHGWQTDLPASVAKSFTDSMQGPPISDADTQAVVAYLETLRVPPNPFRQADGTLTPAAERGRVVFESSTAGCARCHHGEYFTDGAIHDVGLGSESDVYQGYNTPMLVGLWRKVRFLHDGRAKSLEALLTDHHAPEKVTGEGSLTEAQRRDLIEYLKSL
jgi:YVTN family beta-propeller protein